MNKFTSKTVLATGLVAVAFAFSATAFAATFSTNLKQGSTGADVKNLQVVLNSDAATQVSVSGAGAPGSETTYFGAATKAAVIKFQNKYASEVLTPAGLTSGTGFVGALTRAKLNTMGGTTTTTTTTTTGCTTAFDPATGKPCSSTTVVTTGSGVTVSAATQPANGLAIHGSSRVPFTKFTLTAGSSDVVVNGVTVERTGAAVDAVFSGVTLLDEDGSQLDIAKTLGSTHQAIVGGTFTVKAGTSKTFTVAGNMASSLLSYTGQVASLSVVAVNTSSTVSGSLPIVGASHTMNNSLTIGTVDATNSSYDPGSAQTKEIGTTGYKFTAVRLTAGSAEDVRLKSIRFYQAGSAGASDLANVKIYVDGTAYDTTVSADGKYYSANLGSGIVIAKGLAKDAWIAGDIVGSGSAGRTVDFDLQKNTDIYLTGETYGQGIIYTGTVNSTASTATPAINGRVATIAGGSVTSINKATSVAAQNIAINLANQVLGGYELDLKGEAISVQSHVFHTTASTTGAILTNVTLVNENGAVVAGPVDSVLNSGTDNTVTFTDTVTYPIGKHTYTLKGKVASTVAGGVTIVMTTTPSTDWTNVTGQTTGNTISLSSLASAVSMNTMTVKAAALAVSQSATPAAQTIVAGGTAVTFANIQLDASASGEDVRFGSIALTDAAVTAAVTDLTACQLYDGATALNTGSNVVNPSVAAATFTFDSTLTVAKNTVKTLTLKCNVASGITGSFTWNITTAQIAALSVTGVTSGSTVTASGSTTTGATQTVVAAGTLVASTSPSSPSFAIAAAGSTGNTAAVIRFRSANEATNLAQLGLQIATASSSASDLVQVSIWDGATQVGTAVFTGTNSTATSTLSQTVSLPKDADKDLTVKVDFAQIGSGYTGVQGDTVSINFYAAQGTGANSGSTVNASGSTSVSGIRLFKSFPVVAQDTLGTAGVADGKLMRFKVTANANGDVSLGALNFTIATSTITSVTNVNLYGYTDAGYSSTISGFTSGQINTTANINPGTSGAVAIYPSSSVNIPAGATYYFELRGTVAGVTTGSSVITTLVGDSVANVALAATSTLSTYKFVWSGNATTTSPLTYLDWTNGYGVSGLPAGGLIQARSN
ncbi:MAG: peptidoglycan-binding protein [Candidatus Pacebacteria bacterium]|jgi:hypothetical protein|nr:peptidoglycan-binding protein [Candidatus Paceibacterota bacterium]